MRVAEALDSSASLRTSSATTAKPRPCSPARAASMAALRASRLVCAAIAVIVSTIPLISCDLPARPRIAVVTSCEASRTLLIAALAWAAAVTPWRATSRVSRAAPAVSSVVRAVSPDGALHPRRGVAGGGDHDDLALGAAGDGAHRAGDLGHRAAGLLGVGGDLLGGGADAAGAVGDLADHRAEVGAGRLVGGDRGAGAVDELVDDRAGGADLVACARADLLGARLRRRP